jgi:benzoate membrane transport protein
LVAALTGQLGGVPTSFSLPSLDIVEPDFSLAAIATATPVLVALMTVQSNIPSIIFMKSQGFRPPERALDVISGAGTIVGSFAGPVAVSLALPPLLLTAGPEAGAPSLRYRAVYLPACAGLLIAFFATTATEIAVLIPSIVLLTMAGLALIGALVNALREIARGPLVMGPLFAFAIALSDMTVFGLGPFFWSLVLGALISLLLERDGWHRLRNGVAEPREEVVRESTSEG